MANPFLELLRGIGHGAVESAATKAMMAPPPGSTRKGKKKGTCTPCEAMRRVDAHRDHVNNTYRRT